MPGPEIIYTVAVLTIGVAGVLLSAFGFRNRKNPGFVFLAGFWLLLSWTEISRGPSFDSTPPIESIEVTESIFITQSSIMIPLPLLSLACLGVTFAFVLSRDEAKLRK